MITPLSSSDTSTSITTISNRASTASAASSTSSSSDDGVSLDLGYASSVMSGTEAFTANSNGELLIARLSPNIMYYGDLSDVQNQINTYTSSLASSNAYESTYSTPSASFLADLNALKRDAASNDVSTAVSDLAKATSASPQYFAGAYDAGDSSGVASILVESTNDMADYLQTQGDTAVQAKAEANAITMAFTPVLGVEGTNYGRPSDPTVTSQISDLAASAANQNSSTTSSASDPMFQIIDSLLKSGAVSNAASLQMLASLDSAFGTGQAGAASASGASDPNAAKAAGVSSYA